MNLQQPAESLDGLLDRAEKTVMKLSDGRLPLEELVNAYEEAGRLIEEAEKRVAGLVERARRAT